MKPLLFSLAGGLNQKQMEQIVDGALRVLEKTGLALDHDKALDILGCSSGIRVHEGRVFFDEPICRHYLSKYHGRLQDPTSGMQFKLEGPWSSANILDIDADKPRPSTTDDLRKSVRLLEGLNIFRNAAPLQANDIPIDVRAVSECKTVLENAPRTGLSPLTAIEDIETVYEMCKVVGRTAPICSVEISISPLKIDRDALDLVLCFFDKGMLVEGEPGPMISAGCTGPLTFPAFFIQALAEWLGSYMVLQVLSDGHLGNSPRFATSFNGGLRFEPIHFDMKYTSTAFGSPESVVYRFLARQLFRYLGGDPRLGGSMRTTSKNIDAQCIAERAMGLTLDALDGVMIFVGAGMLSIDEIFSPELAVIDLEILRYAERINRSFDYNDDLNNAVDLIDRIGPTGSYLSDDSTVQHYKDYFWDPELFEHPTLAQWEQLGRPRMKEKVSEIIRRVSQQYTFQLPRQEQREIDHIYSRYVGKKRS